MLSISCLIKLPTSYYHPPWMVIVPQKMSVNGNFVFVPQNSHPAQRQNYYFRPKEQHFSNQFIPESGNKTQIGHRPQGSWGQDTLISRLLRKSQALPPCMTLSAVFVAVRGSNHSPLKVASDRNRIRIRSLPRNVSSAKLNPTPCLTSFCSTKMFTH